MDIISLNGEWMIDGTAPDGSIESFRGSVPGCALNDIINSGAEKEYSDIFYRDNSEHFRKYEDYAWCYRRKFTLEDKSDKAVLVFERLDTYCDIYVNNEHIAYCDNGNIEHRLDVSAAVNVGENEIEVYFYSPVQMHRGRKKRRFAAFSVDRLYTRRMQCTYGWDWVARFLTCGIGNAHLEVLSNSVKTESVYVYTKSVDKYSAAVGVDIELENYRKGAVLDIEVYDEDGSLAAKKSKYCAEKSHRFNIDMEEPKLWYPNGYGKQPLYTLVIKNGERELYRESFGIRTVKVLELEDKPGSENFEKCVKQKNDVFFSKVNTGDKFSCFTVIVNGKKIMCKGGNWVPCEPFAKGSTDKKVTQLLEAFAKAGVNMLRIWGGGAFETEHFYNECSRLGIMVSQDFLMACGDYPEEDERFVKQLNDEAEYVTMLARNKACLIWWTGDNENGTVGYDECDDFQGRISAQRGAAPIIYKNDPHRRFFPTSPYGGDKYACNTAGMSHNTFFLSAMFDFIENGNMAEYKDVFKRFRARFSAEEPTFGAISEVSLKKFMTDEDIYGSNKDMWLYHTKNNPVLEKELFDYCDEFAEKLFGKFEDGYDRLFKYKYIQYEWLRISLELVRREKEYCSGVLYWMMNDCWPAASGWSLIDYYGIPKAAYYSFKRAAKQIVLSVDFEENRYKIHICNDGEAESVRLRWYAVGFDGDVKYTSDLIEAEAVGYTSYSAAEIGAEEIPDDCFVVAEIENGDRAFYKKGALEICPCNDRIEVLMASGGCVKVRAKAYVHAVELEGEAIFDDNYFSLMPNEEKEVRYDGKGDVRVKAYTMKVR